MRKELEGKAESMHSLDLLLRHPWPQRGTNPTHFGGCSFVPFQDVPFHCCSLWFLVPQSACAVLHSLQTVPPLSPRRVLTATPLPGARSPCALWHSTASGMPATTANHFGKAWRCRARNQPFAMVV